VKKKGKVEAKKEKTVESKEQDILSNNGASGHGLISKSMLIGSKMFGNNAGGENVLNVRIEVKTLENLKTVFLEDLVGDEEVDCDKLMSSFWFEFCFCKNFG
jgi:hypothetical protein